MTIARPTLAASLLFVTLGASADVGDVPAGNYGLDKTHGYVTFSYNHLGYSNPHVGFDAFEVDLDLDNSDVENSTVNVTIDARSVNSRVAEFNDHLNGERFFDTASHPTITFRSTAIETTGENTLNVTGDLTIKGITRPVTLETTINKAANHPMRKTPTIGISAMTEVSRSDFGMDYAVPAVSDAVIIWVEAELPLQAAE